jgi:hypothetical protein
VTAVGALLLGLVIVGGVLWIAHQPPAAGGVTSSARTGQQVPGSDLTFPATQGGTLSLARLHGRKVVLYFYEEST